MFADNIALFSYLYSTAIEHDHPEEQDAARRLRRLGLTAFTAGAILGTEALTTYIEQMK
jgi:hypothetical protein